MVNTECVTVYCGHLGTAGKGLLCSLDALQVGWVVQGCELCGAADGIDDCRAEECWGTRVLAVDHTVPDGGDLLQHVWRKGIGEVV